MTRTLIAATTIALAFAAPGPAAVVTKDVTYESNGTKFTGLLAYDDASDAKRPGVLVVHEWWGLNDYAKDRAKQLAGMGYVAFACDMYGDGKTTQHPKEAGAMASAVRANAAEWTGRATAALDVLKNNPMVDGSKLAAIGYCFGGSTVQQLAYSGADLKAVASFHGAPVVPTAEQAKAVKAKILIAHGADDGFIPKEKLDAMLSILRNTGVKVTFESYPGAVHGFTVPHADQAGVPGLAYNKAADEKSWAAMKALFADTVAAKK